MVGTGGATRAAIEEAAAEVHEVTEVAEHDAAAAVTSAQKPGRFRRFVLRPIGSCVRGCGYIIALVIPKDKVDRASVVFSLLLAIAVPAWFKYAQEWNPHYTPIHPEVWAWPMRAGAIIMLAHLWLLVRTANDTSRSGLAELSAAAIAALTTLVYIAVIYTKAQAGNYFLGPFQMEMMRAAIFSTLAPLVFGFTMKWYLNRRTIANVNS